MVHISKQILVELLGEELKGTRGFRRACDDVCMDAANSSCSWTDASYTVVTDGQEELMTLGYFRAAEHGELSWRLPTCPKCAVLWDQAREKGRRCRSLDDGGTDSLVDAPTVNDDSASLP